MKSERRVLDTNFRWHDKAQGLTLIEVLIALAIIGIAMMAVIKTTSQRIHAAAYLQDKTIAAWTAQQVINEVRAGLLKMEGPSENLRLTTNMLGQDWYWQMDEAETPHPLIKKIIVKVYQNAQAQEAGTPIIILEGYVDHEATA